MFIVYDFMLPYTHGPTLMPNYGSDSAYRLVINGPWNPARFFGQPAHLPTVHRLFTSLLSWWSERRLCLTIYLQGLGCYRILKTPILLQFFQKGSPLGLGATIIVSFYAHSPLCPWVRWYHDHHRGDRWDPRVYSWHNLCMPGAEPLSNYHPVII